MPDATRTNRATCPPVALVALAGVAALLSAAGAAADEVMVGYTKHQNVTVTDFDGRWLSYKLANGLPRYVKIGKVSRIVLDGEPQFSAAEIAMAAGEYDAALTAYKKAQPGDKKWLAALIAHRAEVTKAFKADPESHGALIVDERAEADEGDGAGDGQGADSDAAFGKRPLGQQLAGVRRSAEALANFIQKLPQPAPQRADWRELTDLAKEMAVEKARQARRQWILRLTTLLGKQVDWQQLQCNDATETPELEVISVLAEWNRPGGTGGRRSRRDERDDEEEFTYNFGRGGPTFLVRTELPGKQKAKIAQYKRGDPIRLQGRVIAFRLEPRSRGGTITVPVLAKELVLDLGPFVPLDLQPRRALEDRNYEEILRDYDPEAQALIVELDGAKISKGKPLPEPRDGRDDRRRRDRRDRDRRRRDRDRDRDREDPPMPMDEPPLDEPPV